MMSFSLLEQPGQDDHTWETGELMEAYALDHQMVTSGLIPDSVLPLCSGTPA